MSTLDRKFNDIAAKDDRAETEASKYPPPFSIRLTFEERARLDADRGRTSLAVHIREVLFGDDVTPRKKPGNSPIKDSEALGRVLGALGGSRLSSNLNQLAKAVNTGSLPVTPETEADLVAACEEVKALRNDLLSAIGNERAQRLPRGFSGIWHRLTGQHAKIEAQNEQEMLQAWQRDRDQKDEMIFKQLEERETLQRDIERQRSISSQELMQLRKDVTNFQEFEGPDPERKRAKTQQRRLRMRRPSGP